MLFIPHFSMLTFIDTENSQLLLQKLSETIELDNLKNNQTYDFVWSAQNKSPQEQQKHLSAIRKTNTSLFLLILLLLLIICISVPALFYPPAVLAFMIGFLMIGLFIGLFLLLFIILLLRKLYKLRNSNPFVKNCYFLNKSHLVVLKELNADVSLVAFKLQKIATVEVFNDYILIKNQKNKTVELYSNQLKTITDFIQLNKNN